jgi:Ni/Co efflux regulator RcnB
MKKIVTLIIAATTIATVHAQTSRDEARKVILGQPKNNGSSQGGRDVILGGGGNNRNDYPTYPSGNGGYGSKQAQIDQVNREYDAKIYSIRANNTLTQTEKERMIRQLEKDRAQRIRQVNQQYGNENSYNKKGKKNKERHDNGKHKGWTKGKHNGRSDDRDDD